jgi:polyisoprenoid-binding protein YceI
MKKKLLIAALFSVVSIAAQAQSYSIDPNHTYPSFEAPHMGISFFRGKFTKTSGKVNLDRAGKTGTIHVDIDPASIDTGHAKLNEHLRSKDFFNVEAHPKVTYVGKFSKFNGDAPAEVQGELTLNGVTKPVTLALGAFKCIEHPMLKREVCGTDATTIINRRDFNMGTYAPDEIAGAVKLSIQVEALKD